MHEDQQPDEMARRRAEIEQRARQLAFACMAEAVLIARVDGQIVDANPAACHLLGDRTTADLRMSLADFIRSYDLRYHDGRPLEPGEDPLTRALAGETVTGVDLCFRTRSGSDRLLTVSAAPIRNEAGQVVLAVVIGRDNTEQKVAENALRASERRFRTVFDDAAIGIAVVDPQGHPIESNRALQEILGYDADELRRMVFTEFTHPDDVQIDWQLFQQLVDGERDSYQIEKRYYRKDGRLIVGHLTVSSARDANGKLLYIIGMVEDFTKRRRAEEERDQLLQQEKSLARIGHALVHELEVERVSDVVMEQCQQILGADAVALWLADPIGRQLTLLAHRDLDPKTVEAIRRISYDALLVTAKAARTGQVQIVVDLQAIPSIPLGQQIYAQEKLCSMLATPLITRQRLAGVVAYGFRTPRRITSHDLDFNATVTDLFAVALDNARLYKEVRETLQLREEFMASAAHELKTPVTTIKGWADLLLRRTAVSGREQQAIETIARESGRIGHLVDDLLTVSCVQRDAKAGGTLLNRERFDLADLLRQKVAQMARTTERVHFVVDADGPFFVEADRPRLGEAIARLLENALRSSPEGKPIEVTAHHDLNRVVVSIRDHGVGIPLERQSHIFDPFYETVPAGRPGYAGGADLGLYLSAQTIRAHGGHIWFESAPGQGSTFSFSLRLA